MTNTKYCTGTKIRNQLRRLIYFFNLYQFVFSQYKVLPFQQLQSNPGADVLSHQPNYSNTLNWLATSPNFYFTFDDLIVDDVPGQKLSIDKTQHQPNDKHLEGFT